MSVPLQRQKQRDTSTTPIKTGKNTFRDKVGKTSKNVKIKINYKLKNSIIMKSFKSILKMSAVAVAVVTMSSSLTSCDVIAECLLDDPLTPGYIVRDVHHYHTYDHGYHNTYTHINKIPTIYERTTVVHHRY